MSYVTPGYVHTGYIREPSDTQGDFTFDGYAKLIICNTGVVAATVEEIYSRWCDWLAVGDNFKWLPAMRYVGGDALSATKNLGVTFFLINGWRIRPQEATHTLRIEGNLYTDPSGFSPFVATRGSYNVMIESTVSSLVDSSLAQMAEIEQSAFEGRVTIDVTNGLPGTTYPLGTLTNPINNLTDAKTVAAGRGIGEFFILGNLTIGATDNVAALRFEGDGATLNTARTTVTLTQGCVTTNSHWRNAKITGYQGGESFYDECIIDGLDNAHCFYTRCGLLDGTARGYTIRQTSSVSSGHASYFKECFSDEGTAIFDRNGARLNVTFDGWMGRLKIINQNHATSSGNMWIHMNGGTLTIDSSCTKGAIQVSGFGTLVDNSAGTVVDATALYDPSGVADSVLAAAQTTPIHSNIKKVNNVTVAGTGSVGDEWRPGA